MADLFNYILTILQCIQYKREIYKITSNIKGSFIWEEAVLMGSMFNQIIQT